MDISGIKAQEIAVKILHPANGEELGITVTLVSLDDERVKKAKRRIQDRRNQLEARGKYLKAEEKEETEYALMFACMTGWTWEGEANYHGKKPEFSLPSVTMVFTELPWFFDQLREKLNEEKSFY